MKKHEESGFFFYAPTGKITSRMKTFYNPDKEFDRDLCVEIVRINKPEKVCDLLSATGIRGVRIAGIRGVKQVYLNDNNPEAARTIKKNININKNKLFAETIVSRNEANKFLHDTGVFFDYVDVDPFGTPNPFLENSIKYLRNNGLLGVTATDSSALVGSYPRAGLRKYHSFTYRTKYMHEAGLRILIKHVIFKGAEQEKALIPVFSYNRKDYFRIYFKCVNGAKKCDELLKKTGYVYHCTKCLHREQYPMQKIPDNCPHCNKKGILIGPLWTGGLWDESLLKKIRINNKILGFIREEAGVRKVGFYEVNNVYKKLGKPTKKIELVIGCLEKKGFKSSRTHFSPTGVKTEASIKEFLNC